MSLMKEKGITLVSLLLTIILLTILSFITVRFLLRDRMLDKANEAQNKVQEVADSNFIELRKHYEPEVSTTELWVTYIFGDEEFDGTNYINTGISLFNTTNLHRDFEVSATISNFQYLSGQDSNRNMIICNQNEAASPYHGFALQYRDNALKVQVNVTRMGDYQQPWGQTSGPITFKRTQDKFYKDDILLADFGNNVTAFNAPLTFGANLDAGGNPRRYSKVDVSNIIIKLKYDINEFENIYQNLPIPSKTSYSFDGWYTALEGRHKNIT